MKRHLIGLVLALAVSPAWAQTQEQIDWCNGSTATDDQTIEGCTALIQSGHETPANQALAYNYRAFSYVVKGQYDLAVADYNKAIALKPDADYYDSRGLAYEKEGNRDQAIADFRTALKLAPDNTAFQENLISLGATQ